MAAPDAVAAWTVVVRDAVVGQDAAVARDAAGRDTAAARDAAAEDVAVASGAAAEVLHAAAVTSDVPAARVSARAGHAPVSDAQHYYAGQQADRSLIVHCAKRRRLVFLPDVQAPDEW